MTQSKQTRSVVAAYACSYVPEEIILAAGMTPKRIIPRARPSEADGIIHPNTCHYIKSLLAEGLNRTLSADLFVVANSCDGMRRLYDLWGEYVKPVPAVFLDVPKKKDSDSIDYFASELRRLCDTLESRFGGAQIAGRLAEAATLCNRVRRLTDEVRRLQARPNSGTDGVSVFNLYLESAQLHPADFAEKLEGFISASGKGKAAPAKCRVVLAGNVLHQSGLIGLIEAAGARVAEIDTCLGARHFDGLVETDSPDPMHALAERYLTKAACPRMEGMKERAERLRKLAAECGARGIIYSSVKFCDPHLYDVPFLQDSLRQAGIPFLFIENDYEWSGLGQTKVRVEAFLNMIQEGEVASHV